ncbi:MAG: lysophospholipase [Chloroflexota bacterium]
MQDALNQATRIWLPKDNNVKGIIVIAHGYGEHSGRYQHVADYFVQQGYAIYAADHRGHGRNRGTKLGYFDRFDLLYDDLKRVIARAREEQRGPLFLLGHSVGGLLALYYAIKNQSTLNGLIVSAPYVRSNAEIPAPMQMVARFLSRVAPRLGIVPPPDVSTLSKDPQVVKDYETDPDVLHTQVTARVGVELVEAGDTVRANLGKITLPILILHGSLDRLANPKYAQDVYDGVSSPDKTIKIYEGLYHEILNEPEKARVLADIWVWMAAHQGTGELRAPAHS